MSSTIAVLPIGRKWEVVVEPDEVEHLLVVVTAYGVEP
jgi:hypothetical protein